MAEEILMKVVLTMVGMATTGLIGYLGGKVKQNKELEKKRKEEHDMFKGALICLLRSNITSQCYVYKKLGSVPPYEKENVNYMRQQYKSMGGNSYVDTLVEEFNNLPVER